MGFAQLGRYAFVPLTEPQKAAWFLTSGRFLRTAASSFIDLLPYPNRTLAMWKVDSRARKTGASQLWIGVSEEVRGRVEQEKGSLLRDPFLCAGGIVAAGTPRLMNRTIVSRRYHSLDSPPRCVPRQNPPPTGSSRRQTCRGPFRSNSAWSRCCCRDSPPTCWPRQRLYPEVHFPR